MSKKPEHKLVVGTVVQAVNGDDVIPAIVMKVHSPQSLDLMLICGNGELRQAIFVQAEDYARHVNASKVGFPVTQFWRWPR